jgi:hypothetical protein
MSKKNNVFRKYTALFLILISTEAIQAQVKISGIILDSLTYQPIQDLSILDFQNNRGTITNENGEFEISVNSLPCKIIFSHVSYKKITKIITSENLGEIYLPLAIINLPEVKTENPAFALLNAAINKAMGDTINNYPCHAYYQKISKEGNNYTNVHEIFFDGLWNALGIIKWMPTNARYANKENSTFKEIQSLTSFVFIHSGLISRSIHKPNSIKEVKDNYLYKIEKYLNFGTIEETAEVVCTPKIKKNRYFEGSIYIKTRNNNIIKIVGNIYAPDPAPKKLKDAYESLTVNFRETDDNIKIDNLIFTQNVTLSGLVDKKIVESAKLIVYEYNNSIDIKNMTSAFVKSDLDLIKNIPYNVEFWKNNDVIKRSNLEKSLIKSFENSKSFESNFILKK